MSRGSASRSRILGNSKVTGSNPDLAVFEVKPMTLKLILITPSPGS